jgi:hypothetical protein
VIGSIVTFVAAASAPAGIVTLSWPSPDVRLPPVGPIVCEAAGPVEVPTAVV